VGAAPGELPGDRRCADVPGRFIGSPVAGLEEPWLQTRVLGRLSREATEGDEELPCRSGMIAGGRETGALGAKRQLVRDGRA
jgi:hypothetical protein